MRATLGRSVPGIYAVAMLGAAFGVPMLFVVAVALTYVAEPMLKRAARYGSSWFPWLTPPADIPAKIDFIKSQPTYDGRPFDVLYGLGTSQIGEGKVVVDDPTQLPGMSAEAIIDQLGWFSELGVTITGVPIPPVKDVNAYLDYAQWVIEEIKPKVP